MHAHREVAGDGGRSAAIDLVLTQPRVIPKRGASKLLDEVVPHRGRRGLVCVLKVKVEPFDRAVEIRRRHPAVSGESFRTDESASSASSASSTAALPTRRRDAPLPCRRACPWARERPPVREDLPSTRREREPGASPAPAALPASSASAASSASSASRSTRPASPSLAILQIGFIGETPCTQLAPISTIVPPSLPPAVAIRVECSRPPM